MLIVTRKSGESVRVYTDQGVIEFFVHDTREGQAKVGILAPKEMTILRAEIDPSVTQIKKRNFVSGLLKGFNG